MNKKHEKQSHSMLKSKAILVLSVVFVLLVLSRLELTYNKDRLVFNRTHSHIGLGPEALHEEDSSTSTRPVIPFLTNTPATTKTQTAHTPVMQSNPTSIISPDGVTVVPANGMVPVFYRLQTDQPVVFLTIDDGVIKDPAAITFMSKHHLLASLFLNDSKISDNYAYFKTLQLAGNPIENHTLNHNDLTRLSYAQQKREICDNADGFEATFGKRPTLFRPPYGAFNDITRRAAADCGMKALIHWHAKANGGSMQYQQGETLQPGDIVLMHFRKEVIADLAAFTDAAQKANLQTVLLEDWIK